MTPAPIARRRLVSQRLVAGRCQTPAEVVAWLGAVQAQDYAGARWSLAMRTEHASDALVEQAFNDGAILRTHLLRPTWHFVVPADIRWLLQLTAPRVRALLGTNDRAWGIDAALIARSNTAIADALRDGGELTRAELAAALSRADVEASGYRLGQLMIHAELDGVVCSGPRRGKQFTYALLDERVPPAPPLSREEALAELARRYFHGHGPATVRDFVWWSGLTAADARAGLAALGAHLASATVEGETYWSAIVETHDAGPSAAFLLPTYDEFVVGYAGFDQIRRGGPGSTNSLVFESTLMLDGQIIGSWRRTIGRRELLVELAPFAPPAPAQMDALATAAQRFADAVGLPLRLATST